MDLLKLLSSEYQSRLRQVGCPLDPTQRTASQQADADAQFWAVQTEVKFVADTLLPVALEK